MTNIGFGRTGSLLVRAAIVSAVLLVLACQSVAGQVYSFAGYAWDQGETPDVGLVLSPGTYDGAIVTSLPTSSTTVTGFPSPTAGFDESLSLSRLIGLAGAGIRGVNLPAGNFGTTARSGVQVSWTLGRRLFNEPGDDFVIYESGSPNAPEALMVQVRSAVTSGWSRWRYIPAQAFATFTGSTDGTFAYPFDLDAYGVGAFDEIDGIRIVNMTDEDRVDAVGSEVAPGVFVGSGFVLPEDAGVTSQVLPDPGPLASFVVFGNSTYDPDPLYVAAISPANTCGDGDVEVDEECDDGNIEDLDGCSSECRVERLQSVAQRRCITNVNLAGSAVAEVQERVVAGCLRDAANAKIADGQVCVESDGLGRVQKKRDRLVRISSRQCSPLPDFGFGGALVAGAAAAAESIALVADLFGADLQVAVVDRGADADGARCQLAGLKAVAKLAQASRRQFQICKRKGMREGTIVSAAGLESCLDELRIDPRAQVFRARQRISTTVARYCGSLPQATSFPGVCASVANLPLCLQDRVDCRVCRMFNAMDSLTRDCDAYDDGMRNGSCPL